MHDSNDPQRHPPTDRRDYDPDNDEILYHSRGNPITADYIDDVAREALEHYLAS